MNSKRYTVDMMKIAETKSRDTENSRVQFERQRCVASQVVDASVVAKDFCSVPKDATTAIEKLENQLHLSNATTLTMTLMLAQCS